jgi:hypothetical protein
MKRIKDLVVLSGVALSAACVFTSSSYGAGVPPFPPAAMAPAPAPSVKLPFQTQLQGGSVPGGVVLVPTINVPIPVGSRGQTLNVGGTAAIVLPNTSSPQVVGGGGSVGITIPFK